MLNKIKDFVLTSPRTQQHLWIAAVSIFITTIFFFIAKGESSTFQLSMGTAYSSLILLSLSLLIGPWNMYNNKKNPLSSYLRRDIGIWAGIMAIIHVIMGLQVHFGGKFWLYFVFPVDQPHFIPVRYDPFGLTNYAGLIAGLIIIVLLSISNNASLKKLGAIRWKKIQRFNYVCAGLVLLHGVIYQLLEKRAIFFVLFFIIISTITFAGQYWGFQIRRNKINT